MCMRFCRGSFVALFSVFLVLGMLLLGCSGSEEDTKSEGDTLSSTNGGPKQYSSPPPMKIDESKSYSALIRTTMGDITIELFADEVPITVNNFVFLAREGFYTGSPFHRVMKGFMIQTGTPAGTDFTGPGYAFEDEAVTRNYTMGTVAMANRGPDTNGSQFFICDADKNLSKDYTIFGSVTEGMDVVHAIASVEVGAQPHGEVSKPAVDVHIERVEIHEGN